MARRPQELQFPSLVEAERPQPLPLPPVPKHRRIPLRAAWASLTPPQQQLLFQQLVHICCGLLRIQPLNGAEEDNHDPQ